MDLKATVSLIVFGHGSSQHPESGASVLQHAERLRAGGQFAEVLPAFWKQEPRLHDVLASARGTQIVIVSLFVSQGYFSEIVVPRSLGLTSLPRLNESSSFSHAFRHNPLLGHHNHRPLAYSAPVGTHPSMTDILLERALETCRRFPFPACPPPAQTTLFVAGHGTAQTDNSRASIDFHVERLRTRNLFAAVHPAFLEESPRIPEVYTLAPTRNVVMVPFFVSDGLHVTEDIPVLLGEPGQRVRERSSQGLPTWRNPTERNGKRLWYSPSAGSHSLVAALILDRARQALAPGPA